MKHEQDPIIIGNTGVYVCAVCKNYVLMTSAVMDIDGLLKHQDCITPAKGREPGGYSEPVES
jgi:hypothetical protein